MQPSETVPQSFPLHAVAIEVAVQTHLLLTQLGVEPLQPPQEYVPPQPFETEPHLPAQAVAIAVGTH